MTKSELIAHVLVNSGIFHRLDDAEFMVKKTFEVEYKGHHISQWNSHIDNTTAQQMIDNIGRQTTVNVKKFIEDLWEQR